MAPPDLVVSHPVIGHAGLVGSAIVRRLSSAGFRHILTARRDQVDLRDQAAVNYCFKPNRPEYVYLVASTMPQKLLDVSRLHALGRRHRIELADAIASTNRWFVEYEAPKRRAAATARG